MSLSHVPGPEASFVPFEVAQQNAAALAGTISEWLIEAGGSLDDCTHALELMRRALELNPRVNMDQPIADLRKFLLENVRHLGRVDPTGENYKNRCKDPDSRGRVLILLEGTTSTDQCETEGNVVLTEDNSYITPFPNTADESFVLDDGIRLEEVDPLNRPVIISGEVVDAFGESRPKASASGAGFVGYIGP